MKNVFASRSVVPLNSEPRIHVNPDIKKLIPLLDKADGGVVGILGSTPQFRIAAAWLEHSIVQLFEPSDTRLNASDTVLSLYHVSTRSEIRASEEWTKLGRIGTPSNPADPLFTNSISLLLGDQVFAGMGADADLSTYLAAFHAILRPGGALVLREHFSLNGSELEAHFQPYGFKTAVLQNPFTNGQDHPGLLALTRPRPPKPSNADEKK